jgi:polar amino acid transport system permease protein
VDPVTNSSSGVRPARGRTPSIPKDALPLAFGATAVSALLIAFAWFVLWQVRLAFFATKTHSGVVDAGLVVLALVPLLLLRFVTVGVSQGGRSRVAATRENLIEARVTNAASRSASWSAIGYAFAGLIAFTLMLFMVVNDIAVGRTFFNLGIIIPKGWSGTDLTSSPLVLVAQAFLKNILIFSIAEVLILVWGLVIAIARLIPGEAGKPIRMLATAYTDVFRGLPSIITIYLVGFGLPLTGITSPLENYFRDTYNFTDFTTVWAVIALTLTYGAYVAEVYRAGIESIHPSQFAAARSLGLSFGQTMRFVIVPQAIRRIIPPLLNDFIGLQKDTALVNVIGAIDAFNQAKIIASNRFSLSPVAIVAFLFVMITIPQTRWVDRLLENEQKKTSR